MLAESMVDVEVARGFHVAADLAVPEDARGVVAFVTRGVALAAACNERGFATVQMDLGVSAVDVENNATTFANVVTAIVREAMLFDRPIGYFGAGLDGVAALVAASLHTNEVAAVVTLDAPLDVAGTHLTGVRAASLFLVSDETLTAATQDALPALPGGSTLVQHAADVTSAAVDWFDQYLRGVMRGARRELWRSA
ncbi:MAG TPA: hypothetical protein VHC63_14990 [Acidimicrobiales bacterium]|nr:hypothetical protein [Acidimicrobiales bacterium]